MFETAVGEVCEETSPKESVEEEVGEFCKRVEVGRDVSEIEHFCRQTTILDSMAFLSSLWNSVDL